MDTEKGNRNPKGVRGQCGGKDNLFTIHCQNSKDPVSMIHCRDSHKPTDRSCPFKLKQRKIFDTAYKKKIFLDEARQLLSNPQVNFSYHDLDPTSTVVLCSFKQSSRKSYKILFSLAGESSSKNANVLT